MRSSWRVDTLPSLVAALVQRPGHDTVRGLVQELLRNGLGVDYLAMDHEVRMPEVRGRADLLFGATVFEFKRNLRQEMGDVDRQLPLYLAEREAKTGRRYLGIATDGATFIAFEHREAGLDEINRYEPNANEPEALLVWLEAVVSDSDDLPPDPLHFRRELGRDSLVFGGARKTLELLWGTLREHPEVAVKRGLWDGRLRIAYGVAVGDDSLFLQHTYLTIIAKTLAARVLGLQPRDAAAILSGQALQEVDIVGAVESDFFDWVLLDAGGADLVARLARQVSRFRLSEVEVDVLKVLYESLIDPEQRRGLGEYYTPDWLASKLVGHVVPDPRNQIVLDPACGSGTFLFHVLRRLIAAGRDAGWSDAVILRAAAQVRGIDIHPVAVIIARVTWLLALAEILPQREEQVHVPIFLGDAMQWDTQPIRGLAEVRIPIPGDKDTLVVPVSVAEDQAKFEATLHELVGGLDQRAEAVQVRRALGRISGMTDRDVEDMTSTYARLRELKEQGRNDIWPFVLRNLVRPIWLSGEGQRADVVIGNPPWIAYRHLSAEMQSRLRSASQSYDLWVGGVLATQQDMAAVFWARCAERYLKLGGTIAFVMPYAALNRPAFDGVRRGSFGGVSVRIIEAWNLSEVRPLFPTSACVLIGRRASVGRPPTTVQRFAGFLVRRDSREDEADRDLEREVAPWPLITTLQGGSVYRQRFKQGATLVPRRFFLVERQMSSRVGDSRTAPRVRGREGRLDRRPWSQLVPPTGPVEAQFLRPIVLGESIAPFRLLEPALAVIPADGQAIVNAQRAADAGYRHLAAWLRDIETKWAAHAAKRSDGALRMTLRQRIDHMRTLQLQLNVRTPRLVYTKAGTLLSAAVVPDEGVIVDHMAYWTALRSDEEGHYLMAVINSSVVVDRIRPMQPRGQVGPRHFDNLVWELPVPEYNANEHLHRELAAAGEAAERLAALVPLPDGHFTQKRRAIRNALAQSGITQQIEALVLQLLS